MERETNEGREKAGYRVDPTDSDDWVEAGRWPKAVPLRALKTMSSGLGTSKANPRKEGRGAGGSGTTSRSLCLCRLIFSGSPRSLRCLCSRSALLR